MALKTKTRATSTPITDYRRVNINITLPMLLDMRSTDGTIGVALKNVDQEKPNYTVQGRIVEDGSIAALLKWRSPAGEAKHTLTIADDVIAGLACGAKDGLGVFKAPTAGQALCTSKGTGLAWKTGASALLCCIVEKKQDPETGAWNIVSKEIGLAETQESGCGA